MSPAQLEAPVKPDEGIEEVLAQLDDDLVALAPVKTRIREIAALLVIDRLRREAGLVSSRPSLHMSFTGNPGTGKTTVALRMAEILHRLGYIEKPKVVSVTRDDLVGQYVGHTAPKTREVLKRAHGGVLFIDEAYYLYRPENERDYGQEAIEILLQVMETERENLVVVLAGYRDRMETFFRSNPGMGSRVAHHIHFPDFDVEELMAIGELMLRAAGLRAHARGRARVPPLRRAARGAAAVRARPQHPQRDRPGAHAPGEPALRPARGAGPRRAHDPRGRGHPRQLRLRRHPAELGARMARPIILGVVGDSAAGKTTITRGLVRILGEDQVTHVGLDDYHRYDRKQRSERAITPLHPDANYMDVMTQHLRHLRAGEPILKPVYQHSDGTFGPATYVEPHGFAVLEGLLGYHTDELCDLYDVRVYLAPPEALRRKWKVDRDCSRRGYTTDQVLAELDRREPDSAAFIRPQQRRADMVVSFQRADDGSAALDADLLLRPGLPHPDLSPFVGDGRRRDRGRGSRRRASCAHPGDRRPERRGEHRGGGLGEDALRPPPAHRSPRRVHRGHGAAPLRDARDRPGARALPAGDREGDVALGGNGTRSLAQDATRTVPAG